MRLILICLALLGLGGCFAIGDSREPIATETFSAPRAAAERTLVIVLPGFGVDVDGMKKHGVAKAIQDVWPEADVLLTSATFAYYRDGQLIPRLHEDVVVPARRAGYRRIFLVGASLGGMGALLYEHEHPSVVTGIVLFAPFLGNRSLLEEISAAGGARSWDPGPMASEINGDNYQRQLWKMVKERPELARRLWLACGDEDRLIEGSRLLAAALPQDRFIELHGGHAWDTWLIGGKTVFSRVRSDGNPL